MKNDDLVVNTSAPSTAPTFAIAASITALSGHEVVRNPGTILYSLSRGVRRSRPYCASNFGMEAFVLVAENLTMLVVP